MTSDTAMKTEDIELQLFLEAVYQRYHYDFRGYSKASIKRRLLLARERIGMFLTVTDTTGVVA